MKSWRSIQVRAEVRIHQAELAESRTFAQKKVSGTLQSQQALGFWAPESSRHLFLGLFLGCCSRPQRGGRTAV